MEKQKISFFDQRTIEWDDSLNSVRIIDQTALPTKLSFLECDNVEELIGAIKSMQIRGAPALGVAGAMGVALAAKHLSPKESKMNILRQVSKKANLLKKARPTAVNLSWGIEKSLSHLRKLVRSGADQAQWFPSLVRFAKKLADEDVGANKKLSGLGQSLLGDGSRVLTHCN